MFLLGDYLDSPYPTFDRKQNSGKITARNNLLCYSQSCLCSAIK